MGYFVFGIYFFTTFFVHLHKPFVQYAKNTDIKFVQHSFCFKFFVYFCQKIKTFLTMAKIAAPKAWAAILFGVL